MKRTFQVAAMIVVLTAIGLASAVAEKLQPVGKVGEDWCKDAPCTSFEFVPKQ